MNLHHLNICFWLPLLGVVAVTCMAEGETTSLDLTSSSYLVEEIIVTGDFRDRLEDELPISISTISRLQMERRSARHLENIISLIPNVSLSQGGGRARFYQIRGIGERSQFDATVNSSVGLLIDGIDFSAAGVVGTLFDVQQVEVLRGPQATRYGANAMAGLINITTAKPDLEFGGYFEQEVSNYNSFSTGVVHSGPIILGRLLYRVALQHNESDGFISNDYLNKEDTNHRNETTLRTKLRWFVYEELTVDAQFGYIDIANGYDVFTLDNSRTTLSDNPGDDKQASFYATAQLTWDRDASTLVLLANWSDSDIDYGYDEDWVYDGFYIGGYSSTDRYQRDRKTSSLEVRLLSAPDALGGRLDWLVGAYTLFRSVDLTRTHTFLASDFTSSHDTTQYALYSDTSIRLVPTLTLSLGLRAERWEADYNDSALLTIGPNDTLWGGKVALQWQPCAHSLFYASVVRGYKAAGFNTSGSLMPQQRRFSDEQLYNFEIGIKQNWLQDKLQAHLGLFHMKRNHVQIKSFLTRPLPNSDAVEFISLIANAAGGTNQGLELEFDWRPNASWLLTGSLGLLNTQYKNFFPASGKNFSGRDQAHAPNWQYALSAEYRFGSSWYIHFAAQGRDGYYFSDSHNAKSDADQWLNLRLGYEARHWRLALWGRNVTDTEVETRGFFFGNDPRHGYVPSIYTQRDEPSRYGATLRVDF